MEHSETKQEGRPLGEMVAKRVGDYFEYFQQRFPTCNSAGCATLAQTALLLLMKDAKDAGWASYAADVLADGSFTDREVRIDRG